MIENHLILLPILLPLASAVVNLLLNARIRWQPAIALFALGSSLIISTVLLVTVLGGGAAPSFQLGGWPQGIGINLLGDPVSLYFVTFSQFILLAGLIYSLGSREQAVRRSLYYPAYLTLSAGLTGAYLTGDIFNLFVFMELLVISGVLLTGISDDHLGVEASFKYFYMSLLASAFMLLAIAGFYASYGTLNMASLAQAISANPQAPLLMISASLLAAGFFIKAAVFPYHFWQPDFHSVAPTGVSAVLSSAVVKVGVYGLFRMISLPLLAAPERLSAVLIAVGLAGVLFGGLAALASQHLKRMLAYSTIAQVGFILVALGWGTQLSLAAALVFSLNHGLVKAAMLMLAGALASRAKPKSAAFSALTGLGRSTPGAAALFLIGALGLAGIPPTNGFISKLLVFRSAVQIEEWFGLALLAIGGMLTLGYTLRAFSRIWWSKSDGSAKSGGDSMAAPALLLVVALVIGLLPETLISVSLSVAEYALEPARYIAASLGGG